MAKKAPKVEQIFVEAGVHSQEGASSAHRWRPCKGSNNLIKKLMDEGAIKPRTNRAAAEGTCAHLVFAACLEDGDDAIAMAGMEMPSRAHSMPTAPFRRLRRPGTSS